MPCNCNKLNPSEMSRASYSMFASNIKPDDKNKVFVIDPQWFAHYPYIYHNCQGYGANYPCNKECPGDSNIMPIIIDNQTPSIPSTPFNPNYVVPGDSSGAALNQEIIDYIYQYIATHPVPSPKPDITPMQPVMPGSGPGPVITPEIINQYVPGGAIYPGIQTKEVPFAKQTGPSSKPGEYYELKCVNEEGHYTCVIAKHWFEVVTGEDGNTKFVPRVENIPIKLTGLDDLFEKVDSIKADEYECDPAWFKDHYYGRCIPFNRSYIPPWMGRK